MESFKLLNISFSLEGRKINYEYEYSKGLSSYFVDKHRYYTTYDTDISDTPRSLAIIPLLANIMPISWLVGFDVYVDEIDENFESSLNVLKEQFKGFHPDKELGGKLHYNKKVKNVINNDGVAQLFSGGLDSWDTFTRNYDKDPFLISIHGADVPIKDTATWEKFKRFNSQEPIVNQDKLHYIETNLRDFYTYKLDVLADLGWWGTVQHGMALIGVLAPLSYKFGFRFINIAASATSEVTYTWGSSPKIDENMLWANTVVYHEGYHLNRTQKVENVVDFVKSQNVPLKLRVCYSDLRDGYNCNICAKCQRTILTLILLNEDPKKYGFHIVKDFYKRLMDNFNEETVMTEGVKYQWQCLQDMAKKSTDFFVAYDQEKEAKGIADFAAIDLDEVVNKNASSVNRKKHLKFILRKKFSGLYNIYQRLKK